MDNLESHYSVLDIEARILAALREAGLDPEQRLSPEELAALDHFHTGGYPASLKLLELSKIKAGDRVDVMVESREDDLGHMVLSKEKADRVKIWEDISQA